jgi:hypothetical protein
VPPSKTRVLAVVMTWLAVKSQPQTYTVVAPDTVTNAVVVADVMPITALDFATLGD